MFGKRVTPTSIPEIFPELPGIWLFKPIRTTSAMYPSLQCTTSMNYKIGIIYGPNMANQVSRNTIFQYVANVKKIRSHE
jgi:glycerol-3-phosphate dehydrogenase